MPTSKEKKSKYLSYLKKALEEGEIFIFFSFKGMKASSLQLLRKEVKKSGGEVKIGKKTLLQKALEEKKLNYDLSKIKEEIGLIVGKKDIISLTKTVFNFLKNEEKLKILGGVLNNEIISEEKLKFISQLPSKEILLSQFLATALSPLQKIMDILSAPLRDFLSILNQISIKGQKNSLN